MRLLRIVASTSLLVFGISSSLAAQQNNNQRSAEVEVERLKIQAEERARQEIEQRDWDTRIFQVKHVDPGNLRQALSMFRASMREDHALRVLSVRAPREIMPAIEDAIKRLDVPSPSKTAELTVFILMATDQPAQAGLPASLQPVVKQLQGVLTYKAFQLVDTLITRGMHGRDFRLQGELSGLGLPAGNSSRYNLSGRVMVENLDGKAPILTISGMQFTLGSGNIGTDVEIPQGQQIVVGKATVGDKAFILVMTARFL